MGWGGKRPGAGRPIGSKGEIQRKQHQIRATDEEWEQIKAFAKEIKKKTISMNQYIEILMADHCSEKEAKKHLANGTAIYTAYDWDNAVSDDSGKTEAEKYDMTSEEAKASNTDIHYIEYKGESYIIAYVL